MHSLHGIQGVQSVEQGNPPTPFAPPSPLPFVSVESTMHPPMCSTLRGHGPDARPHPVHLQLISRGDGSGFGSGFGFGSRIGGEADQPAFAPGEEETPYGPLTHGPVMMSPLDPELAPVKTHKNREFINKIYKYAPRWHP